MYRAKKILGLIGRNVGYSYSPYIHNTAAEKLGLGYYYTIFNISSHDLIPSALEGAKALGIAGFNVTIPYKKTVVASMDRLSPEADAIGAVNTIVNDSGTLIGYNTDIAGIVIPLEPYAALIDTQPVGIFGNGGAAIAAIEALGNSFNPSGIHLFVREREKGNELCRKLRDKNLPIPLSTHTLDDHTAQNNCRLLINATPIGTKGLDTGPAASIIPSESGVIHSGQIVFDMVYNPMETPLLRLAEAAGAIAIPGIEMLIGQASRSFEIWTGKTMPVTTVRKKLQELLLTEERSS